jgi:hypothetical protein
MSTTQYHKVVDMDLTDWFATFAPEPTKEQIQSEIERERLANPYNDSYKPKRRSNLEIICDLKYEYGHQMMMARFRLR